MYTHDDTRYMRRALQLAAMGRMDAPPNPMVGAVIVCDGKIIGEGYHRKCGGPHAEVNAVAAVADEALLRRSTIYVTLEPCSHYGKTPPCAKLLVEKGLKRVVICNDDPFPQVAGRGISMLREAGAEVEVGLLKEEGLWLNRRFFTFHTKQRPYIILKFAQTSDGMIADLGGRPISISTPTTRRLVHRLRAQESSILVGAQTALSDDPSLTVRHWAGDNPLRLLIDQHQSVAATAHIYSADAETLLFTALRPKSSLPANVKVVQTDFASHESVIRTVLSELRDRQLQSLIVEGGRRTLQHFIDLDIWDEIRVEQNPRLTAPGGIPAPQLPHHIVARERACVDGNVITTFVRSSDLR